MMRFITACSVVFVLSAGAEARGAARSPAGLSTVAEAKVEAAGEGGQIGGISKGLGIAKKANDVRELRITGRINPPNAPSEVDQPAR